MKTQQRTFIVERKSGRRRTTAQPNSIWGDTDLKAIARKAEADAPHLFEQTVSSAPVEQDGGSLAIPRSEPLLIDHIETNGEGSSPASEKEQNDPALPPDDLATTAVPRFDDNYIVALPREIANDKRKSNTKRITEASVRTNSARSGVASAENLQEDLAVLEEENRQLRRSLAIHLAEQNTKLRKMLARFEVV